jgi:hypothetical protein
MHPDKSEALFSAMEHFVKRSVLRQIHASITINLLSLPGNPFGYDTLSSRRYAGRAASNFLPPGVVIHHLQCRL